MIDQSAAERRQRHLAAFLGDCRQSGCPTCLTFTFGDERLRLVTGRYSNGRLAVQAVDAATGEPWATLSVNLPDEVLLDGAFFLKAYSENVMIARAVMTAGLIRRVPDMPAARTGFVTVEPFRLIGDAA